eukprot:CAMPEP_0172688682 /NCGR_PEP_ID=MMETSP1074-20121228/22584_1 /TAXON_ID=2916 /ORGANISM="Ceratium fusus, Strain PA161109" /LENGTH=93 /DNA_ID=CAMNT_0013508367 /DNA_START=151 /DNA_END=429 /DNA_ORIENTATION=+
MSNCCGTTACFCLNDTSQLELCGSTLLASNISTKFAACLCDTRSAMVLAALDTEAAEDIGDEIVMLSLQDTLMDSLCNGCSSGKFAILSALLW